MLFIHLPPKSYWLYYTSFTAIMPHHTHNAVSHPLYAFLFLQNVVLLLFYLSCDPYMTTMAIARLIIPTTRRLQVLSFLRVLSILFLHKKSRCPKTPTLVV